MNQEIKPGLQKAPGGAVLCALLGAIYHARSLRKNDKSKEAK